MNRRAVRETAANVEMQGIEFQIINDSDEAARGIDALAASLDRLKTSLGSGGSSLSRVAKNISGIRDALSGLNTQKLENLGNALEGLKAKTDGLKISSSIGNQLKEIGTALNNIPDVAQTKLSSLAEGLKPLSELGRANLTSFINQLGKLPAVIEELDRVNVEKFAGQMERLAAAMKPFADQMQKVSNGFSAFPSRIQKLITSTDKYNGAVKNATSHTGKWKSKLSELAGKFTGASSKVNIFSSALKAIGGVALFKKSADGIAHAVLSASEYVEVMNTFKVSLGEYAQEAFDYAQKVGDVLGIDPSEFMGEQGVLNSIITGFGVAGDKASVMSKNLTQLGYDLQSLYGEKLGTTMSEMFQKVESAISGELEPVRRLGFDLSVARLEQDRLALGIKKSVSEMNQAEKTQLRYHAMLTQLTFAQGDFARNLETPANMLRILKSQISQVAREIGNLFLPALQAVLPVLIAVANAVRSIVSAIGSLFGIDVKKDLGETFSGASSGASEIADSVDDAAGSAKKLKSYMMGIDELNVISQQDSSGSGSDVGGASFDLEPIDYSDIFLDAAVLESVERIKAKIAPFVEWFENSMERIKNAVAATDFDGANTITEKLLRIFNNPELEAAVYDMSVELANMLNNLTKNIDWYGIGSVIGAGLDLALSFAVGFIYTYDWQAWGAAIAQFVNGEITEIDWNNYGALLWSKFKLIIETLNGFLLNLDMAELAQAASNIVLGFFDSMTETIQSIDWFKLGEQVKTFLVNIDWSGIAVSVFTAIGAAFGAVTEFLWGLIHDAWESVVGWWYDVAYEDGQFTFEGLLQGITDVVANIGAWIKENIFEPFINGFKSVFGIHSPSTVMAEMGGYMIDGLFVGLRNFGSSFQEWFEQHVKPYFSFETWAELFTNVKDAIVMKVKDATNAAITLFNKFIDWVNEKMHFEWDPITIFGITVVPGGSVQLFTIPHIPMLAEGGFPDMGQMFIANEAGPELVGTIGRRTAVVNNDQIVASVAGGVAEANESQNALLREQNELLRAILAKDTSTKLDGKTLLRSTEKAARQRGAVIMAGGVMG